MQTFLKVFLFTCSFRYKVDDLSTLWLDEFWNRSVLTIFYLPHGRLELFERNVFQLLFPLLFITREIPRQSEVLTTIKTKGRMFASVYEEEAAAMESALTSALPINQLPMLIIHQSPFLFAQIAYLLRSNSVIKST